MRPLHIRTERLLIDPLDEADAASMAAIINDPDVAPMLASFSLPYTEDMARERIAQTQFRDRIGFFAAIRKDRTMIGGIGIGGDPVDSSYFLGRDHWGQGYASEAMTAFLDEMFARYDLAEVEAGAFNDNPASQRVLVKLGFEKTGEALETSKARLEPALCFKYRLPRATVDARKALS